MKKDFPEPEGPSSEFVSLFDPVALHRQNRPGSIFTGTPCLSVKADLKSAFFHP